MLSLSKHEWYYQTPFDRLRVTTRGATFEIVCQFLTTCSTELEIPNSFLVLSYKTGAKIGLSANTRLRRDGNEGKGISGMVSGDDKTRMECLFSWHSRRI
jgi:hypothetical protein